MKRLFFAFLLLALNTPALVLAQSTDVYGDAIYAKSSSNLLTAENGVGSPDDHYVDFRAKDTYLTIDMGEGEEGLGDLLVTMKIFDIGAVGRATLYDADFNVLATVWPGPFAASLTTWTVPYEGVTAYRYVKIESTSTQQWSVDAVQATQVNTPSEEPAPEPTPTEETVPYCTVSDCGRAGELIKVAESETVYFIGLDGKRHIFPNGETLVSWSYSFDQLFGLILDDTKVSDLNAYPLGKNMTIRPGTFMVKVTYDPKVYAVEPGGVLRWVTSEAVAAELYGDDWNKQIVDVSDVFWGNYKLGTPITNSFEPPVGYHFIDHDRHYLVTSAGARPLNDGEVTALRLDNKFAGSYEVAALNATEGLADNSDLSAFLEAY